MVDILHDSFTTKIMKFYGVCCMRGLLKREMMKYQVNLLVTIISVVSLFSVCKSVNADVSDVPEAVISSIGEGNDTSLVLEDRAWKLAKIQIEEKLKSNDCKEVFSVLWPYVKKRHVDAEEVILSLTMFPPFLNLPGRGGDYISRARDIIILASHSPSIKNELEEMSLSFLKGVPGSRGFFQCRSESHQKDCSQLLVEKKIIPSFQSYLVEVDALLDTGLVATCSDLDNQGGKDGE